MTEPAPPAKRRGKLPFSVSRLNILGIVAIIVAAGLIAVHNLHHDNSRTKFSTSPTTRPGNCMLRSTKPSSSSIGGRPA